MTHLELCSLFTHKAGGGGHPRGTWEVLSRDPHSAGGLGIFHTEPCTILPSSLCLIHPTSKTLGQCCFTDKGDHGSESTGSYLTVHSWRRGEAVIRLRPQRGPQIPRSWKWLVSSGLSPEQRLQLGWPEFKCFSMTSQLRDFRLVP